MRLSRIAAPQQQPLTLEEVKAHLKLGPEHQEDDLLVQGLIDAAVDHLDGYRGILGRCLVTQTWRADITRLGESIALPFPDSTVTEILYTDEPAGAVEWVWHESLVRPTLIPTAGWGRPVSVTFTAGFGGPADVPQSLKLAMLTLIDHWYNNRCAVGAVGGDVALSFGALIDPWRVRRV